MLQLDELKNRMRVLRRLGYTTSDGVIDMKGRVACEISAGDELVLTEMLTANVFAKMTVEQIVALLSCFTFGEKVICCPLFSFLRRFPNFCDCN